MELEAAIFPELKGEKLCSGTGMGTALSMKGDVSLKEKNGEEATRRKISKRMTNPPKQTPLPNPYGRVVIAFLSLERLIPPCKSERPPGMIDLRNGTSYHQ